MRDNLEAVNKKYHSINEFNNKWLCNKKSKLEIAEDYYNQIKPKCLDEAFDLIAIDKIVKLHTLYIEVIKEIKSESKK